MTTGPEHGRPAKRRILLVETLAHRDFGHFPVVFARLAEAFLDLGLDVEVLTSRGWSLESDASFPPLRIHRYGRVATGASRFAARLHRVPPRALGARLVRSTRTAVAVVAARALRRRVGATDVIVVTTSDPLTAGILAGPGRWLCYAEGREGPRAGTGSGSAWSTVALDEALATLSRRAEAWRRRRGGELRVVTTTEASRRGWEARAPWAEPVAIPLAAVLERRPVADARERLGLPRDERLALFFGAHGGKDCETVWRAFERLRDWRLVVAGAGGDDAYRRWAAPRAREIATSPILLRGFVDEATKDLLHAAADLAVLSFQPGRNEDSGTLTDAISWGLPVVCSDGCVSAETVRRHGLGVLFRPGDAGSLVDAVRGTRSSPDPDGLRSVREELSVRRTALRHLDALGR